MGLGLSTYAPTEHFFVIFVMKEGTVSKKLQRNKRILRGKSLEQSDYVRRIACWETSTPRTLLVKVKNWSGNELEDELDTHASL